MGKAIVITSGKGGTGKNTTAAALSCFLASFGYRTLCLDADMGLKNLDLCLGLSDLAVLDFLDVLDGRVPLSDAVVAHPRVSNLFFLTAPVSAGPEAVSFESMQALILEIKRTFDFCVIDSPAGIGSGFRLAACCADKALVVATTDCTSYRDAARVVIELTAMGLSDIRLIVTRVRPSLLSRMQATIDDSGDAVGAQLIGIVPEDKAVILAANSGIPLNLFEDKGAAKALKRTAQRLLGQKIPIRKIKKYV
jgi:septum site-determining protein MinD